MCLIIRTTRQDIQQREVANYRDDNTYNKEVWLIQQRDVANYTDDNKTYNKEIMAN